MTLQIHDHKHHDTVCDQCVFDTDVHHFDEDVIQASHQHAVLVDMWADWCGPCHFLTPVLLRVVPTYGGRVRLAKIEVDEDENMKIAGRYGARGFPTVLMFVGGQEVARFHGAKPEHFVRQFIDAHLQG